MNLKNPVKSAQWQRLTLELCGSIDGGCCHPRHIFIEKCRHMPNKGGSPTVFTEDL